MAKVFSLLDRAKAGTFLNAEVLARLLRFVALIHDE